MARRGDKSDRFLLGSLLPLVQHLPPKFATRLVNRLGRLRYRLRPDLRRRIDPAVRRISSYFGGTWDERVVGGDLVGNTLLWQTRDRLLDGCSDTEAASVFEVRGRENLDRATADGRGAILLCNHFGAHMMPAHWLVREGYPLRLFMERPRSISKYLARGFDTEGPTGQKKLFISRKANPAESAGSILRACRAIRSGAVLFIAGDVRWSGQLSARGRFLGREYALSCTWVTLAALTGAPVVTEFCVIRADGSYLLEFLEPYTIPRCAEHPDRAGFWVQRYLELLEERVRLYPSNSNDYFFWDESVQAA